jgi:small-conductance mechanosensitive channel
VQAYDIYVILVQAPLVRAAAILAGFALAAALSHRLFGRVLLRLARGTETEIDDRLVELLQRPIFWSVVTIGVLWAAEALDPPPEATFWGSGILLTLLILVWSFALVRLVLLVLQWLSARGQASVFQPRLLPLFNNVARVLIAGGAIYLILLSWDINVAAWVASAGIIGIAVGFAARDTLANLFAGIFILTDAPYKLGDYIVLDGRERGRVTEIGIRSTRILTRDDVEITVPNNIIANAKILNESGGHWEKERIRVAVDVAYGSDIDRVREVLLQVAAHSSLICREPEPRVRFREFGESGLRFELLVWIGRPEDRGRILDALNSDVYKSFAREDIEIPYAKRDVYIRQWSAPPPVA